MRRHHVMIAIAVDVEVPGRPVQHDLHQRRLITQYIFRLDQRRVHPLHTKSISLMTGQTLFEVYLLAPCHGRLQPSLGTLPQAWAWRFATSTAPSRQKMLTASTPAVSIPRTFYVVSSLTYVSVGEIIFYKADLPYRSLRIITSHTAGSVQTPAPDRRDDSPPGRKPSCRDRRRNYRQRLPSLPLGLPSLKGWKTTKYPFLWLGRPVPGSVEGDKGAVLIPGRELAAGIEQETIGCKVTGERDNRLPLRIFSGRLLTIPAIFRGPGSSYAGTDRRKHRDSRSSNLSAAHTLHSARVVPRSKLQQCPQISGNRIVQLIAAMHASRRAKW